MSWILKTAMPYAYLDHDMIWIGNATKNPLSGYKSRVYECTKCKLKVDLWSVWGKLFSGPKVVCGDFWEQRSCAVRVMQKVCE